MLLAEIVVLSLSFAIFIPISVFCGECFISYFFRKREFPQNISHKHPRVKVLIPAHNEAENIISTLRDLLPQVEHPQDIVVIADNCRDETAKLARSCGVTVLERENLTQRGKGYAVDYGVTFLSQNPPDIVIIVDADCQVSSQTVYLLTNQAYATQRPVQGTYLMLPQGITTPKEGLSTLAIIIKNLVRPYGLAILGLPCLLNGSGMAFPWSALRQVPLANGKTVDDLQLSIDLAIAGYAPLYCPKVRITGRLMKKDAARSQRSRWEHGHLETLVTEVPRLLKEAIRQKNGNLLALALELAVPPLSFLVLIWLALMSGTFLFTLMGMSPTLDYFLGLQGLLLTLAILASWGKFGQKTIPMQTLREIPRYLLWKLPIYKDFWGARKTQWLVTERDQATI